MGSTETNPWSDGDTEAMMLEDLVRIRGGCGEHGIRAELAQSVERVPLKHVVLGSSPRFGIFYVTKFKMFSNSKIFKIA